MYDENRELRKLKSLNFALTFECEKDCRHCAVNSVRPGRGRHIPFRIVRDLISDLLSRGLTLDATVGFTGGEPFLYRDQDHRLADAVEYALERGFGRVEVQTAGWSEVDGDPEYDLQYERLAALAGPDRLSINLSFNLYQNGDPVRRLTNTVARFWDHGFNPAVYASVDLENYLLTYLKFYAAMTVDFGAAPEIDFETVISRYEEHDFSFRENRFSRGDSHYVLFKPSVAVRAGRARGLRCRFFRASNNCRNILGDKDCLLISPRCEVYLCCQPHVYAYMCPVASLAAQSVSQVLYQAFLFRKAFREAFTGFDPECSLCEACAAFCRSYPEAAPVRSRHNLAGAEVPSP